MRAVRTLGGRRGQAPYEEEAPGVDLLRAPLQALPPEATPAAPAAPVVASAVFAAAASEAASALVSAALAAAPAAAPAAPPALTLPAAAVAAAAPALAFAAIALSAAAIVTAVLASAAIALAVAAVAAAAAPAAAFAWAWPAGARRVYAAPFRAKCMPRHVWGVGGGVGRRPLPSKPTALGRAARLAWALYLDAVGPAGHGERVLGRYGGRRL